MHIHTPNYIDNITKILIYIPLKYEPFKFIFSILSVGKGENDKLGFIKLILTHKKIEKHIDKRQKPHHYYGEAFLRRQSEIIFKLKIYELKFINQLRIEIYKSTTN